MQPGLAKPAMVSPQTAAPGSPAQPRPRWHQQRFAQSPRAAVCGRRDSHWFVHARGSEHLRTSPPTDASETQARNFAASGAHGRWRPPGRPLDRRLRQRFEPEHHYLFVQQLRKWFRARGIDIDQFTVRLSADEHRWIHNE